MAGYKFAQGFACSRRLPLIGIHHHEAHLYSPWIQRKPLHAAIPSFQPNLSLIVSGGHTLLVHVRGLLDHQVLGGTLDDAAGECFDKVAKLIGLPYPGGPEIDRLAGEGNPKAYAFPRPLLHHDGDDFSFSGLKTSVRYHLRDHPEILEHGGQIRDLCASVQAAIVEVLAGKTVRAAQRLRLRCVTASGGVTCNRGLRQALATACDSRGIILRLAESSLCTDNAAMVGILASIKRERGCAFDPEDAEIDPGWALGAV
jgi:N6-L-threonylcarbamoyladenine synthase